MNYIGTIFAIASIAVLAKCGGPPPAASPKPADPCGHTGVSYSPIGQIAKMDEVILKERREYGTHVLLDGSGNIQWVLQSPKIDLNPYTDDNKWYRVEGERSQEHPDLFIVCLIYPEN